MDKKLILIARVSTTDQKEALPAQELRLKKYADETGLPYEYFAFDESAFKDSRQKFNELVDHIKKQKGLCLVAFDKTDRFSRDSSQEEVHTLKGLVKQGRIELHFPSDSLFINKSSPAGEWFRLDINLGLAAYYSRAISDNVHRKFEQLLDHGCWPHRAPIGYKNRRISDKETTIDIDPMRAPYIIKGFELRAVGMPYEVVAKTLAEEGLRSVGGKVIAKSYMEAILNNPFYCGTMIHDGKSYPHRYEPLISRDLFNQCKAVKMKRGHEMTKHASADFMLKQLPKCGRCGRAVSSYFGRKQVYLRCAGTGQKSCGNPNTAEALLMPGIESDVSLISMIPEQWLEHITTELRKRHDNQQLYFSQAIQQMRDEFDGIGLKLKQIYYDRLDGRLTVERHDEIATELGARQQELNDKLKRLTGDNKTFQITASYLLDLAHRALDLFNRSNPDLRQQLLSYMLSNVELNDRKLSYVLAEPFSAISKANKKAQDEPNSDAWQG